MNVNVNDISGFDAITEEIRQVYAERDRLQAENEELKSKIEEFTVGRKYQEDFTEESASILGVNSLDLTLSDISACLRKFKRYEKLNDMNSNIIAGLSVAIRKICAELDIEYSTDTTPDDICDRIRELRAYRKRSRYCPIEEYNKICDILGTDKNGSSWGDILEAIHELYVEKIDLSTKVFGQQQAIKQFETSLNNARNDTIKEYHKRKEWVRRYEAEHERANSCDRLYKKYKGLYDADEPKRKKMADDLQVCQECYNVVKNSAVKNKSMIDAVKSIVGAEGLHDDTTLSIVQDINKKAKHWRYLVDAYGEGTIRSLLENIGIDVSGDNANGLFV